MWVGSALLHGWRHCKAAWTDGQDRTALDESDAQPRRAVALPAAGGHKKACRGLAQAGKGWCRRET